MISWKAAILESNMAAISGFITANLKIQDGGQTKELKEHRIYKKSYAPETFRRRSSEPSYHPIFGQIFYYEIFNNFDSGHSVQHIVKFSVPNLV